VCAYYQPGNCPEWLTCILVCTNPGASICQNNNRDRIFELRAYCEELAQHLNDMGIQVSDPWNSSNLGVGEAVEIPQKDGFSGR
jgi:hypothetical protein